MPRFLIEWPAGVWSSQVTDDPTHAATMRARGAVITPLDAVTDAGELGVCCTVLEPKKEES